jgi:hypothetical protein
MLSPCEGLTRLTGFKQLRLTEIFLVVVLQRTLCIGRATTGDILIISAQHQQSGLAAVLSGCRDEDPACRQVILEWSAVS